MNDSVTEEMPGMLRGSERGHFGLSQEALKCIACVTMLIDHIGAVFLPGYTLRIIGRLSFPIYCFLLAEGVHHTRNPGRYALRLAASMILSEFSFDLAFFGRLTWQHQSVMVTLLLGFFALQAVKKCPHLLLKVLVIVPFALLARKLRTDYSYYGVWLVALFGISRELPHRQLIQLLGMVLISLRMSSARIPIGIVYVPIQLFAALAILPIALYSGRRASGSKLTQWGFYLFYPVHLLVLYLIRII